MDVSRLERWRKRRVLSQAELAERSGVHVATIKRIEAGHPAHPRTIRKLAEALGVSPEDLVKPAEAEAD
jgi:transcriptional regulator with XRE-family HTH domain